MSEVQPVQWFPGHMAKTRRKIREDLKLIDAVAELIDARIPKSSANPVLREIIQNKPKVVLLNKSDLADPAQTDRWISLYRKENTSAVALDSKTGKGVSAFYTAVRDTLREQIGVWERKGMGGRPIRIMVLGVPNVGKSSFINRLLQGGAGKAEVRDQPGVTRQNRWFAVGKGFELLDTPGVLWPKFEDPIVGEHLAFTGAVRDEIVDVEGLAGRLLEVVCRLYPKAVGSRYKISLSQEAVLDGYEVLQQIGKKRGMLVPGGEIDMQRAAVMVLDEYRGGKMGRMTLEQVEP